MTQSCYRCGAAKPIDQFIRRVDERHYNMCRECVTGVLLAGRSGPRQRLHHTETERTCYLCRRLLPVAEFTRRSNGTYFSACKACNLHVFGQRRRARLAASEGTYTRAEWEAILVNYDACPGCARRWHEIVAPAGRKSAITVDHKVPISRGGRNDISNLQPMCFSCNSRKGNRL